MQLTEGKTRPGKRDGTGPYKGSYRGRRRMPGRRKAAGEPCPRSTAKAEAIRDLQISRRGDLEEQGMKEANKLRPSKRPLKRHRETADKFLETRKAIDELNQQAAAIRAIIAEREKEAGGMAQELMQYAEEYEDRMLQTKSILLKLEDIPGHKSQLPPWKKVMEHLLDMLEGVSSDMRKEAEAFIEDSKREIPGQTELLYQELESIQMTEAENVFKRILGFVKKIGQKISGKLASIDKQADDLVAQAA